MALNEGDILAGKYHIERLLGEGGMGAVYVATNQVLQKRIALKVMNERFAAMPAAVERFLREAVAASRVSHAGIVQVFDAGEHEGKPWIAMELLEGESLGERLERGPMSLEEVLAMADGALSALAEVHEEGIIHRDLKPDNIFLARVRGGGWVPKVLDFGVAKDMSDGQLSKLTATGAVVGTAHYLSPEQAKGVADIDARADVYAMGVVLFEALSGWMPYEADSITQLIAKMFTEPPRLLHRVAPHVPAAVADVVATCLEQDREKRFQTARALLEALRAAGEEGVRARVDQGAAFAATAVASSASYPGAQATPSSSASSSGVQAAPSLSGSRGMHGTAVLAPPMTTPPEAMPEMTPEPKRSRAGLFAVAGLLFVVGALATVGTAWVVLDDGEGEGAELMADARGAVGNAEAQAPLEPEPSPVVVPLGVDPSEEARAEEPEEVSPPEEVGAPEPAAHADEAARPARRREPRRSEPRQEPARAEPEPQAPEPQRPQQAQPQAQPAPSQPAPSQPTPARPPTPQTGISYAQVMAAVRGQLPRMQERCYERRLQRVPNLAGVITIAWTVTAAGRAEDIQIVLNGTGDEWLARCARNIVADTRFPSAANGASTPARYPFQFRVQ